MTRDRNDPEDEAWEYGDAWKKGSPEDDQSAEEGPSVEILRGHGNGI